MASIDDRLKHVMDAFQAAAATAGYRALVRLIQLRIDRVFAILEDENLEPEDRARAEEILQELGVQTLDLDPSDFQTFRQLQVRERQDWLATFTVEESGGIFPFVRWGQTPIEDRHYVNGGSEVLEAIARAAYSHRGSGRFFIRHSGVFYKDQFGIRHKFLRFTIRKPS